MWLQRMALRLEIPASRRPRHGCGIRRSNPNEITACLSMVSVPSAVVSLIRKTEPVNIRGGDFYIDFEFVSLGGFREDDLLIQRFPVEIAVRRLLGQVVIDTPIKYDKSIPELLAGIPRTGSTANFSWAVMRKVYGQEKETFGKTWDELRHLLHDADMEKDSYVVEWSNSGIPRLQFLEDDHATTHSFKLHSTYPFLEDRPPWILKYETELLLCFSLSGFQHPRARSPGEFHSLMLVGQ